MLLTDLIDIENDTFPKGIDDLTITGISDDSRNIKPGMLFVAISGNKDKGINFVDNAILSGAKAVLCHKDDLDSLHKANVPIITSMNPRISLAKIAAKFYNGQPKIAVAVTGTNGKSSTVHFLYQIWSLAGLKGSSIGTLGVINALKRSDLSRTTPGPIKLHKILSSFYLDSVDAVAIEASSHGLEQHRLDGMRINVAALTNVTRDHLDYHGNFNNYLNSKLRLFSDVLSRNGKAILNSEDKNFNKFKDICESRNIKVISYGMKRNDDWRIRKIVSRIDRQIVKISFQEKNFEFETNVTGSFQISNIICALAISLECGISLQNLKKNLDKIDAPPGRLSRITNSNDKYDIFIDYAHTPDALRNVLKSIKPLVLGNLVLVFGCGGERDKEKRAIMGKVAESHADIVFVTDDNPRNENPSIIRRQIMRNCPKAKEIEGREKAIITAIKLLSPGDVLVISGKGHEVFQEVNDKIINFNDFEIAKRILSEIRTIQ